MIKDRYGEKRKMNNGQMAQIVKYDNAMSLDIMFEDGTVVKNKQYNDFLQGKIANPSEKIKRLGETKTMNCGLKGTIIAYRKSNDIDVRLEGGTIAKNKTYAKFQNGSIRPTPEEKYLNKSKKMKCGLKAKIIAYRSSTDIDVEFEDGIVVPNRTCGNFDDGTIKHPQIEGHLAVARQKHLGQTNMMRCKMEATVVEYRKAVDIDVLFADGTIVKHRTWNAFKEGRIANPSLKKEA